MSLPAQIQCQSYIDRCKDLLAEVCVLSNDHGNLRGVADKAMEVMVLLLTSSTCSRKEDVLSEMRWDAFCLYYNLMGGPDVEHLSRHGVPPEEHDKNMLQTSLVDNEEEPIVHRSFAAHMLACFSMKDLRDEDAFTAYRQMH